MNIDKMLDKEATRVSKEYAGMIALPTVGLALSLIHI